MYTITITTEVLTVICFLIGFVFGAVSVLFIRIAAKQGDSNTKPHYIPTPEFSYPPPKPKTPKK